MTGLKARLADGERLIGALLRMPAEEIVEMLGVADFDYVVIDCEHGPADLLPLRSHLAFAEAAGVAAIVRVGSMEPALVLRVLDAGAAGVIAPHIDTVEQARALVDSAHYPPLGARGFATYGRAGRYGQVSAAEHTRAAAEALVIGMIESPAGVAAASEIFAVPGLDGTMVGVADLAASSTPADPDPAKALQQVHEAVAASGKLRMDIVNTPDRARAAFDDGAQLVTYNLTHTLMDHFAALRAVRP